MTTIPEKIQRLAEMIRSARLADLIAEYRVGLTREVEVDMPDLEPLGPPDPLEEGVHGCHIGASDWGKEAWLRECLFAVLPVVEVEHVLAVKNVSRFCVDVLARPKQRCRTRELRCPAEHAVFLASALGIWSDVAFVVLAYKEELIDHAPDLTREGEESVRHIDGRF